MEAKRAPPHFGDLGSLRGGAFNAYSLVYQKLEPIEVSSDSLGFAPDFGAIVVH